MRKMIVGLIVIQFVLLAGCIQKNTSKIDLSGEWRFAVDSLDRGIAEKWYDSTLQDALVLPGSMNSNGKGDDINLKTKWTGQIVDSAFFKNPEYAKYRTPANFKIPFWLQPLKHYQGAAWYQKEVNVPSGWGSRPITLFLERVHWESQVWIDGQSAGMRNSLGTPHVYDLTGQLPPGKHRLTICIDNRIKEIDPGINSHSVSDHTQTNWNGMVGKLFLEVRPRVYLRSVKLFPDVASKTVKAELSVFNSLKTTVHSTISLQAFGPTSPAKSDLELDLKPGKNQLNIDYKMGDSVKLWDEFHPNVYQFTAIIQPSGSEQRDSLTTTFGMRSFSVQGKQIEINGRPVFLRGTLECAIFPKTGFPATEESEWSRIFNICRAHGLNHIRFHSWCPPEAAFAAADKAGFYLQVECSSWANVTTTLGDGKPIDQYLYDESERMVDWYGNHPSFCMMVYGNEPAGSNQVPFLTQFVDYWKTRDARRIYTSGAGWPNLPVNDYLSDPTPRIQRWGEGLNSIINAKAPQTDYDWTDYVGPFTQPVVSHEIGQWCVYPNFKEIPKYDGVLRARNLEVFQETLQEHGMAQLADSFLLASGKLQALCYKADIEAALRTPGMSGFQLLDLHDFPGQGTALVGVLDPFWDEKGYISPEEYRRFCNSTVPLVRMKKLIYTNDETFIAKVEVAHYGEKPVERCMPEWKITDATGTVIGTGKLQQIDIPVGTGCRLGTVSFPLASVHTPSKLVLEVAVNEFRNSWEFWVYPAKLDVVSGEQDIRIVQKLDEETARFLQQGGSVLLNLKKGTLSSQMGGDIQIGFSSIFWNTAWTNGQAPHTLGILCNPKHPALQEFPTEFHSNWQWWDAMSHSGAILLTSFPAQTEPIARVIDDWFTNRPLGLIVEGKAGNGRILISGIDLQSDLASRPEASQLLYSLKKYMCSGKFSPRATLDTETIKKLTD